MKRNDEKGNLWQQDEECATGKSSFLRDLRPDPEHDDGADGGCANAAEPSWLPMDAEEVEQPLTDDTADESKEQIDPAAFTFAAGDLAGYETSKDSHYDCNNKISHNVSILKG